MVNYTCDKLPEINDLTTNLLRYKNLSSNFINILTRVQTGTETLYNILELQDYNTKDKVR